MKQIALTQDRFALVDDEDFASLSQFKWCFTGGYACRRSSAGKTSCHEYMHKRLMTAEAGMVVIHRDGDRLNNQRANLMLVPRNMRQQRVAARSKAGYKGVSFFNNRFVAQICIDGRTKHLGRFSEAVDAARAYDTAAIKYYGAEAKLNFPNDAVVGQPSTPEAKLAPV